MIFFIESSLKSRISHTPADSSIKHLQFTVQWRYHRPSASRFVLISLKSFKSLGLIHRKEYFVYHWKLGVKSSTYTGLELPTLLRITVKRSAKFYFRIPRCSTKKLCSEFRIIPFNCSWSEPGIRFSQISSLGPSVSSGVEAKDCVKEGSAIPTSCKMKNMVNVWVLLSRRVNCFHFLPKT